jgi:hypothetical protein
VIQLTSGVTIKILGTVRNALLVLFTVFGQGASGESVSDMQFLGYFAGQKVHIFRRPKTTYFSPAQNHIFFAGQNHIFFGPHTAHVSFLKIGPSFADRPGAPGFLPELVDVVGAALTPLQWGCVAASSEV